MASEMLGIKAESQPLGGYGRKSLMEKIIGGLRDWLTVVRENVPLYRSASICG